MKWLWLKLSGNTRFDAKSPDRNHVCTLGLSRNMFRILKNISTLVGISCRGHSSGCGIYVWFFVIDLCIGTRYFCGWCGRWKSIRAGGGVLSKRLHGYSFKSTCFFYSDLSHNLAVVFIYTYNISVSRVINVQFRCLCGDIGRFTSGS